MKSKICECGFSADNIKEMNEHDCKTKQNLFWRCYESKTTISKDGMVQVNSVEKPEEIVCAKCGFSEEAHNIKDSFKKVNINAFFIDKKGIQPCKKFKPKTQKQKKEKRA